MRLLLISFSVMPLLACGGTRPGNLGVNAGRLLACPPSPNCVSSFADDEDHRVAPFDTRGAACAAAHAAMLAALGDLPRVQRVTVNPNYVHAEVTSSIWRFVDDVELFCPAGEAIVHVRSASRLGYSDFGANRKRVEALRAAFAKWLVSAGDDVRAADD